ncbi:MAG: site-2 protease family protein [Calditrichaeota bacterium]|nr:MAG: site-2 protease family protein [Calditrichota bacterium]
MNDRYDEYNFPPPEPLYRPRGAKLFDKLRSDRPRLNAILFVATYLTTFITGWLFNGSWVEGLWYSTAIISILLAHEMGHYLMCRKYGIQATLPFFIPSPFIGLNPFGTFGAVIRMESTIPSRKALFDVAVAGPLAGLALTIPAIYFGVQLSQIVDATARSEGTMYLGESFLFTQLSNLAIGKLPETKDVMLHPLAYAGWAGLFVTALNLLPIGQLDGGHVVYALFGRRHSWIAMVALVGFGGITVFLYRGWILLLLLLIWFGHKHPPTMDERPLDAGRIAIGLFTLAIFFLSFTPEPFKF